MAHSASKISKKPTVCIIGAGFAGLRCADVLLTHDVQVTICEARDRIGGRLCQSRRLGHLVDIGPNWIHGTQNNPILDLARITGTALHSWDERQALYDRFGRIVPEEKVELLSGRLWGIIADAFKYSKEQSSSIPSDKSLLNFFEEKVKETRSKPAAGSTGKIEHDESAMLLQMAQIWGSFVGSPIAKQSLKFFWLEECIEGENLFVSGTYEKILAHVALPALERAEIQYNCNVVKIEAAGATESRQVRITTKSGQQMHFDHAVLTAPLGWLKRNTSAFEPPLPARIERAIDSISYGQLDKVYINFPTAFWNRSQDNREERISTRQGGSMMMKAPNSTATALPLHQNRDSKVSGYPGFIHWVQLDRPGEIDGNRPSQDCVSLASLPDSEAHPTLLFYTYGPTSEQIAAILRQTPADEVSARLMDYFRPYYSLLPSFDATDPDCEPAAVLASGWANDEFAGYGSYSNFQTGLEDGDKDLEAMRMGMPERCIWLAGEHTAPFIASGTVTGAYWSGEDVAKRILASCNVDTSLERPESSPKPSLTD